MTGENIRAFKLFLRAAEAGHSEAQNNLVNAIAGAKASRKIMWRPLNGIAKLMNKETQMRNTILVGAMPKAKASRKIM